MSASSSPSAASVISKIIDWVRLAAKATATLADAREALAQRLAERARAGDFDDLILGAADSDAFVEDFIKRGE